MGRAPETEALPDAVRSAEEAAREAALAACWGQWGALGALASAPERGAAQGPAIVDPEALVLLSLLMRDDERRLDDFLGWVAEVGPSLLSVQRMQNLAADFPAQAQSRMGDFARLAAEAGDRRWRPHQAELAELELAPRAGKGTERLALRVPAALVLRLRAGFGVGAKADLLALLLGLPEQRVTIRDAAEALRYSEVALRTAAQEMVLAGFVTEASGRPARYAADAEAWGRLLHWKVDRAATGGGGGPRWQHWAGAFAFLAAVRAWARAGQEAAWSPYVWSSRARDLCERHGRVLEVARVQVDRAQHRGVAYLGAFSRIVREVSAWVRAHA